jgi:DNA polymerase III subunit gamma/tau
MSYLVLARKWRPQVFTEVIGQEHIVRTLENAIASNRIAHAYLFTGPRGVGKTTTARILSKCLNCEQGPTAEPCGECSNCKGISDGAGQSLDVIEIDGASNNGVEEVRNLRENVRYSPAHATHKIIIIDEVHMLTSAAFNALLKTLEEPPSHVVFIFATTEPQKVPPTILSRCQRFDFKRIPLPAIDQHLKSICEGESITIEPQVLTMIARKADGGLRDAQSLLDQVISFSGDSITLDEAAKVLGLVDETMFFRLTDAIRDQNAPEGLAIASEIITAGFDPGDFLTQLLVHFRNLLVTRITGSAKALEVAEESQPKYRQSADEFTPEDILRLIAIVTETEQQLKRSSQPATRLELAILSMVYLDKSASIADILDRLQSAPEHSTPPASAPAVAAPTAAAPTAAPTAQEPAPVLTTQESTSVALAPQSSAAQATTATNSAVSLENIIAQWDEIVNHIIHESPSLGNFLAQVKPVQWQNGKLTAETSNGNGSLSFLQMQATKINQLISDFLHCPVKIEFEVGEPVESVEEKSDEPAPLTDREILDNNIRERPIVKDIIQKFEANLSGIEKSDTSDSNS